MNRTPIVAIAIFAVIAAILYSCYGSTKDVTTPEYEYDPPVGAQGDSPQLPNMEFNITINQSQNDNSTQDNAAEYNAPASNRESLLTVGILALLDIVIIVILIGAITKRRTP